MSIQLNNKLMYQEFGVIQESTSCVVEKGLAAFKASSGKKKTYVIGD